MTMRGARSSGRQNPIADVYRGCFEIFTLRLGGDAALAFPNPRPRYCGPQWLSMPLVREQARLPFLQMFSHQDQRSTTGPPLSFDC